VLIQPLR